MVFSIFTQFQFLAKLTIESNNKSLTTHNSTLNSYSGGYYQENKGRGIIYSLVGAELDLCFLPQVGAPITLKATAETILSYYHTYIQQLKKEADKYQ